MSEINKWEGREGERELFVMKFQTNSSSVYLAETYGEVSEINPYHVIGFVSERIISN